MPIIQQGSVNTTALVVPDLYVQIVPPQTLLLNGVPTNIIGIVGSASWGPVGQPVIGASSQDYASNFGPIINRKYDLGTQAATAIQQGAQNFVWVRATDGTDNAAQWEIPRTSVTLTALYTGSLGSQIMSWLGTGSAAQSWRFTIALPGQTPEVYDNLTNGVAANTVVAGTEYTTAPAVSWPAPSLANGVQATGYVPLAAVAIAVVTGGSGYTTGETVTFQDGVTGTVTCPGGVVSAITITNAGSTLTGAPSNPTAQVTTSGGGTGLTVDITWGLGTPIMTNVGSGYAGTEGAATILGNTGGSGGSITPQYAIWPNLVSAVNNGNGVLRGPSQIVVASGTGTAAAAAWGPFNFASGVPGTDGASAVTAATLVGVDTSPRKGMYALRGQGCSIALLADTDDSSQWTTQAAFGLSEGIYMILTGPSGDTIENAVSINAQVGLDTYAAKMMFGDWIYWNDPVNQVLRLVSPQGFVAGRLANLSPEQSSLNKPIYSIVGSQKSGTPGSAQASIYASADLQTLFLAGIDVISNPQPGGNYWGVRCGHNCSSNAAINGDNYTRLTNYIAATLSAGMGAYVGQVVNASLFQQIRATQLSFLQGMLSQGMLGSTNGNLPFSVICDTSNNPPGRTGLGYVQSDAQIQYQAINEKFIVNIEGGQTVTVTQQSLTNASGMSAA